ncbi:2-amino-4-hydroxy-6-hydroxymethyldihydropteridine diphosphokinase [Candidatus Leptofilum sp.]|uniref:2-amino-4-hydroxy-6- hydroxymethyldihydropteridine diphosphokinase n=1 Tax=Candidatus Leptofilum sp. TaxID=3241576 RepID=UPI003B5C8CBC
MPNQVVIALGSNIEKEKNLPRAIELLREMCAVTAVSPIYETEPVGLLNQPNFWNTAVLIQTDLTASQIKQQIIGTIETRLQRVRLPDKNAPRTIDADIVLFNDAVLEYDGGDGRSRPIPDPDLAKFPHVAVPVADLLPNFPHPETGEPLGQLAERLMAEVVIEYGRSPLTAVAENVPD